MRPRWRCTTTSCACDRGAGWARGEEHRRRGVRGVRSPEGARQRPCTGRAARRGLARGAMLRVRMGLHVGHGDRAGRRFLRPDVNRAARVMSAAHGGQIVCTAAVAELVRDSCRLVDLGEHRLRDLQSPVHLFQVDPGAGVPPAAVAGRVPVEPSGRAEQFRRPRRRRLRQVAAEMRSARVVSIVGVGGGQDAPGVAGRDRNVFPTMPTVCGSASSRRSRTRRGVPDAVAARGCGCAPPQGVSVADRFAALLGAQGAVVDPRQLRASRRRGRRVRRRDDRTSRRGCRCSSTSREALGVRGERARRGWRRSPLPADVGDVACLASDAGALFGSRRDRGAGEFVGRRANASAVGARPAAPRRDPTRDRARRGAGHGDDTGRDPRPARQAVPAAHAAAGAPASSAIRRSRRTIDWSYDLLDEPTARVGPAFGLRRRLHRQAAEAVCAGRPNRRPSRWWGS